MKGRGQQLGTLEPHDRIGPRYVDTRRCLRFDGDCEELFRVWYNNGALNGDGVQPQGVITAYRVTHGGPTWWENDLDENNMYMPESRDTAAYRTGCPIY